MSFVAPNELIGALYAGVAALNKAEANLNASPVPPSTAGSSSGLQWRSSSPKYVGVDSAPQKRTVHTNIPYEESSVWWNPVLNNWGMYCDSQGSSPMYYYSCSGDPNVNGNWGNKTAVLGSGVGGMANQLGEPNAQIFGNTIYTTFLDITANVLRMCTAPLSNPTAITVLGTPVLATAAVNGGQASNCSTIYSNGVYYLFIEVDGGSSPGIYLGTATNYTGGFTISSSPLASLYPHAGQPAGPFLDGDGVTWVLFYVAFTGTTKQGGWPPCLWRATNTNLATDTWVNTDVVMTPAIKQDSTAIADPYVAQGPNGSLTLFYTAANFRGTGTYIACVPMLPALMQWTGTSWARAQAAYDPTPPAGTKEKWLQAINAASFPQGRRCTPGRGSPATYFNSSGVRLIAPIYTARTANYNFNNGSSWVNGGALNEAQSINALPWSSVLTNAVWNFNSLTAGTDTTTDVAGAVATKGTAVAGNTAHRIALAAAIANNQGNYAFSVDVLAGTSQFIYLALQGTTNIYATAVFNLTGTAQLAATQTAVGSTAGTIVSATGINIGNSGWWRLNIVGSVVGFPTMNAAWGLAGAATGNVISASGSVTFNAAGTETFYTSSPMLEPNASAVSSYIPSIGLAGGANGAAVRNTDPTAANPCVTSAGTWVLDTTTAGMVFGAKSNNTSAAQNDAISFDLDLGDHNPIQWAGSNYSGATYHVKLLLQTGPAQGIVSVNIVNTENSNLWVPASGISYFCGNIDTYSSSNTYNVAFECNDVTIDVLFPGRMALYLTVTDKNAASSGYGLGWHVISVYRVDI